METTSREQENTPVKNQQKPLSLPETKVSLPGERTSSNSTVAHEKHINCVCSFIQTDTNMREVESRSYNTRPKVERLYLPETFSTNGGKVAKTNLCFNMIYFQSLVIHDPTFEANQELKLWRRLLKVEVKLRLRWRICIDINHPIRTRILS